MTIMDALEPVAVADTQAAFTKGGAPHDIQTLAILSLAISAKRIADALEGACGEGVRTRIIENGVRDGIRAMLPELRGQR